MSYIADIQYFPSITYIITLCKQKNISFCGSTVFRKSTFRNRMVIPGSNGLVSLSIPIAGGRNIRSCFKDVRMDDRVDWKSHHFKTIRSVYGGSPFFTFYEPELKMLYSNAENRLFNWNLDCLSFFLKAGKMGSNLSIESVDQPPSEETLLELENHQPINDMDISVYQQVFMDKIGFQANVSCLDLLMNLGPDSAGYIQNMLNKLP